MSGPLSGIRVLDFTTFQAGSQATGLLADLGADVIKVESTTVGDPGRLIYRIGPQENRQSVFFYVCNRGKRSVALDLKKPEAVTVIDRLVAGVDAVTNNFRPGVMERLNLSYNRLRRINPKLVYVSLTGWGKRGPKVEHPALDTAAQARGGLVWQTRDTDGFPVPAGAAVADYAAAMNLVIAVLCGIVARNQTGKGQEIDLSLFGAVLGMQAPELTYSMFSNKPMPRAGRGHPLFPSLTRVFQTADGFFAILAVDGERWSGFCRAIGRADLRLDERFKDDRSRNRNMSSLYAELDPVFLTKKTAQWIALLEAEDQVCAPVQSYDEIAHDPVAIDNCYIREIDHPRLGEGKAVAYPFEFHATSPREGAIDPRLGEHTREVLIEAGLDEDEINSLIASGAAREEGR